MFAHNLHGFILGEVQFDTPWSFAYYYADGTHAEFRNVVKLQPMSTGCYVLTQTTGVIVVVAPGHRYCIETPQQGVKP